MKTARMCNICKEDKPVTEFYADKTVKSGLASRCKLCANKIQKKANKKSEKKRKKYTHNYNIEHREERKVYRKNYRKEFPEKVSATEKQWLSKNEKKVKLYHQERNAIPKIIKRRRVTEKKYWANNLEKCRKRTREYQRMRRRTDPMYRIRHYLSTRLYEFVKGKIKKSNATMKLVGCTLPELRLHLESQFTKGMTWKNYGKWHVDHIQPCRDFVLTDPVEQAICFGYKNLRPLWAKDNLSKGSKALVKA